MEKLKELTIILIFLLMLSTVIAVGTYFAIGYKTFEIVLGLLYVSSSLFILFIFTITMMGESKE